MKQKTEGKYSQGLLKKWRLLAKTPRRQQLRTTVLSKTRILVGHVAEAFLVVAVAGALAFVLMTIVAAAFVFLKI